MKLWVPKDYNTHSVLTPIPYKINPLIGKPAEDKGLSISIDIKTQPRRTGSETVALYVPIFKGTMLEALLKFWYSSRKFQKVRTSQMDPRSTRWWGISWPERPFIYLKTRPVQQGQKLVPVMTQWWTASTSTSSLVRCFSARKCTFVGAYSCPTIPRSIIFCHVSKLIDYLHHLPHFGADQGLHKMR